VDRRPVRRAGGGGADPDLSDELVAEEQPSVVVSALRGGAVEIMGVAMA
jgi:hypothetical protein